MPPLPDRRSLAYVLQNLPVDRIQSLEDAQSICDTIGYCVTPDVRMQVWDITAVTIDPVVVQGAVSNPFSLEGLRQAFTRLGTKCDASQVVFLPHTGVSDKRYALVTSTECPLYSTADRIDRSDTALLGDTLFLLRRGEYMSLVHAHSGYLGWVENMNYRAVAREEWIDWSNRDRALFLASWDLHGLQIPGGAELPLVGSHEVMFPTGTVIRIEENYFVKSSLYESQQRTALITVAKSLMKTPYVWGGTSPSGIDCSGFTRYVYRSIGMAIPRDADQQFLTGKVCALPNVTETLVEGDLLFFSGSAGGVGHVGIALNSTEFIHAKQDQGVLVSRLTDSEIYFGRFLLAKRLLR